MTNHPNRGRTYWQHSPRGFANEYSVGIATSKAAADDYAGQGYDRIRRGTAIRELAYRGDAATEAFVGCSIDGRDVYDRFEVVRAIRNGDDLPKR